MVEMLSLRFAAGLDGGPLQSPDLPPPRCRWARSEVWIPSFGIPLIWTGVPSPTPLWEGEIGD